MNASIKLIAAIAAMNAAGFTINAETLRRLHLAMPLPYETRKTRLVSLV